jgi:hypothetical protein
VSSQVSLTRISGGAAQQRLRVAAAQHRRPSIELPSVYGEHDFASVTIDGIHLFWKTEYFQKGSNYGAGVETPEDAATTDRLLTIMRVDEY